MATRLSQFRTVTPALVEQRRAERHAVTVTRATVLKPGGEPVAAELFDLSAYGCRFSFADPVSEGERLQLGLNGHPAVAATVVWCREGFVGCRFDQPIARSLVRDLTLTIR